MLTKRKDRVRPLFTILALLSSISCSQLVHEEPPTPPGTGEEDFANMAIEDAQDADDAEAQTQEPERLKIKAVERVSVNDAGQDANGSSMHPSVSSDGRLIAFVSQAANLGADNPRGLWQVYLRDRDAGHTQLVSLGIDGSEGNGDSFFPQLSHDGRFVLFVSHASNLTDEDTNDLPDLILHDRHAGTRERIVVGPAEEVGWRHVELFRPQISADGRFIAYVSDVAWYGDEGDVRVPQLYLMDRSSGSSRRLSQDLAGRPAKVSSGDPYLSHNGRYLIFVSAAPDLVAATPPSGYFHVYLYDTQDESLTLMDFGLPRLTEVSTPDIDVQGSPECFSPLISEDGRWVHCYSELSFFPGLVVHDRKTGTTQRLRSWWPSPPRQLSWSQSASRLNFDGALCNQSLSQCGVIHAEDLGFPNMGFAEGVISAEARSLALTVLDHANGSGSSSIVALEVSDD